MVKNLFLLGLLTWVTLSYAKEPMVARESIDDAKAYKVEKPTHEQEATRGVAGSKIKKHKKAESKGDGAEQREPSETDSEVRYWQYSE
jgi:hypothetical protein